VDSVLEFALFHEHPLNLSHLRRELHLKVFLLTAEHHLLGSRLIFRSRITIFIARLVNAAQAIDGYIIHPTKLLYLFDIASKPFEGFELLSTGHVHFAHRLQVENLLCYCVTAATIV
jgi:hypothetical protein